MNTASAAEDMHSLVPIGPGSERLWLGNACLTFRPDPAPSMASVSAIRANSRSIEELVHDASEWMTARGRSNFVWILGPSTTPPHAEAELLRLGATPFETLTAMTLDNEPTSSPDVEVREVENADELLVARTLLVAAGGGRPDTATLRKLRESNETAWLELHAASSRRRTFLAYQDGIAMSAGSLVRIDDSSAALAGGATAEKAQGRGLYRALVHARWIAARSDGLSRLVVTATPRSAPTLAKLGFRFEARLTVLLQGEK